MSNSIMKYLVFALGCSLAAVPAIAQDEGGGYLVAPACPDPAAEAIAAAKKGADETFAKALDDIFEPIKSACRTTGAAVEVDVSGFAIIPLGVEVEAQERVRAVLSKTRQGTYTLTTMGSGGVGVGIGVPGLASVDGGARGNVLATFEADPHHPGEVTSLVTFMALGMNAQRQQCAELALAYMPDAVYVNVMQSLNKAVQNGVALVDGQLQRTKELVNQAPAVGGWLAGFVGNLQGVLPRLSDGANAVTMFTTALKDLPGIETLRTRVKIDAGVGANARVELEELLSAEAETEITLGVDKEFVKNESWLCARQMVGASGGLRGGGFAVEQEVEVKYNPESRTIKVEVCGSRDILIGQMAGNVTGGAGTAARLKVVYQVKIDDMATAYRNLMTSPDGMRAVAAIAIGKVGAAGSEQDFLDAMQPILPVRRVEIVETRGATGQVGAGNVIAGFKLKASVMGVEAQEAEDGAEAVADGGEPAE